jgi:hypothetical protein
LADGAQKDTLVFAGTVDFLNRQREVAIYLTDSDEALVGTRLLSDCQLTIDFPMGKVLIARKLARRTRS